MLTRPVLDLGLYLVTDPVMTQRHGLLTTVSAAIDGGASVVQLRDPDAGDDEVVAMGRLVLTVTRPAGVPLIINDRAHLVAEIGADGAHIGQGDLDAVEARRVVGPHASLGLSCARVEEVERAATLPPGTLDYLGLGPVWATPTKPDHDPAVGLEGLRALAAASRLPSVAIGGIGLDRAAEVMATGVDGVAVVSAVCAADDPRAAAARLRAVVDGGAA